MTDQDRVPKRIQRHRTKGWRMPEGAVYVGRPSRWGNPFTLDGGWIVWAAVALGFNGDVAGRRSAALALYRAWMTKQPVGRKSSRKDCGAIGYADGTEVPTSQHVEGFAGAVVGLYPPPTLPARPSLDELRGKDLACFCAPGESCHADVLLEIANG